MNLKSILSFFYLIFLVPIILYSQEGIVQGYVYDKESFVPLPGARVNVDGTNLIAFTGNDGKYTIYHVPVGETYIRANYLNYREEKKMTVVEENKIKHQNYNLEEIVEYQQIYTNPRLRHEMEQEFMLEQHSINMKNVILSDLKGIYQFNNPADALQSIPGISIDRSSGEGRYVLIYGLSSNMTSVTLNGERLPSPSETMRNVPLDLIPLDVISSIEINKTITPDMDGDAIGGNINIITKDARFYKGMTIKTTAGAGYNFNPMDINFRGAFTFGKRYGENEKVGFLLTGSYYRTNRGADADVINYMTKDFQDGKGEQYIINNFNLNDNLVNRTRMSFGTTIDYKFNENSKIYLTGLYNRYDEQLLKRTFGINANSSNYISPEIVNSVKDNLGTTVLPIRLNRNLADNPTGITITSFAAGGKHLLGNNTLDYQASFSYSGSEETDSRDISYTQPADSLNWNLSVRDFPKFKIFNTNPIKYDEYQFTLLTDKHITSSNMDYTAQINYSIPFLWSKNSGEIKFGGKFRGKNKEREINNNYISSDSVYTLDQVLGDFEIDNFLGEGYEFGLSPDPDKVIDFINNTNNFDTAKYGSDKRNYINGKENIIAGYLQGKFNFGDWKLLVGARFEMTNNEYTGNQFILDTLYQITEKQVTKTSSYSNILPMLHLAYNFNQNSILRFAYTSSLSRPNFIDLTPHSLIVSQFSDIYSGNTDLKPISAMNFDLKYDYYFDKIGNISAAGFYKILNDYIVNKQTIINTAEYNNFTEYKPDNGDAASLYGFEVNWRQPFNFLQSAWNRFGIILNYTFTDSKAKYPIYNNNIEEIREAPLQGQSQHVGNLSFFYEHQGLVMLLGANFRSKSLIYAGQIENNDTYLDNHIQLDFSLSYQLTKAIFVFVEAYNLTNSPYRIWLGDSDRSTTNEYYKQWLHGGFKIDI